MTASVKNRVANRPEFFGTVPNSDAVSRVPNGSIRDRLMSRIFTTPKCNVNKDPYYRFLGTFSFYFLPFSSLNKSGLFSFVTSLSYYK